MNSSHTGRAARRSARSLADAFGPYTDNRLHPMPDPYRRANWALYIVAVIAVIVIVWTL